MAPRKLTRKETFGSLKIYVFLRWESPHIHKLIDHDTYMVVFPIQVEIL
jgi:hypothetical protein